jgi:transcriptional regulator with XRE-family HTH domain
MEYEKHSLGAIKVALKAKGMTYSELAPKLGLTEVSIKRLLTVKTPMTLDRADEICSILGTNLLDLLKSSRREEPALGAQLTEAQEQVLAGSFDTFILFYSLVKGLLLAEFKSSYKFSEARLQKALSTLDRAALIEWHPGDRIKLLVTRNIRWIDGGPLSKKYDSKLRSEFVDAPFKKEGEFFRFTTVPLTARSRAIISRKFQNLVSEIEEMSAIDLALDRKLASTATVLIGMREWTPSIFLQAKESSK